MLPLSRFREHCCSLGMLFQCREVYSIILDVCILGVTLHRRGMDDGRLEHKLLGVLGQFKGKASECVWLSGDIPLL